MVISVERLLEAPASLGDLDVVHTEQKKDFDKAIGQGRNAYLRIDAGGMWDTGSEPFVFNTSNYQNDGRMRWIYSQKFKRPEVGVYALHNVKVITGVWQIVIGDGRLVEAAVPTWNRNNLAAFVQSVRFQNALSCDLGEVDEPVVQAIGNAYSNYGHWHHDSLPSFLLAEAALGQNCKFIGAKSLLKFNSESLAALRLDGSRLVSLRDGVLSVPLLYVPSRALGVIDPCRFCVRMYDQIRTNVYDRTQSLKPASNFNRRIYVARFDAGGRRGMVNEQELASALENEGFEVVTPGALNYVQQVTNFAEASVIIGQHGAGLMNAGFMLPNSSLVEIHPVPWGVSTFPRLVHSRQSRFYGYFVEAEGGSELSMKIRIHVDDFLRFLNRAHLI